MYFTVGWDFSSRWLADGKSLSSCRTTDMVPIDLNAFLFDMENNLADFAAALGHHDDVIRFRAAAAERAAAIRHLMYCPTEGEKYILSIPR